MNKIKEIAKAKKISTSNIIESTGIARSHMYEIINDKITPTITTAWKIAKVLETDINTLFPNK